MKSKGDPSVFYPLSYTITRHRHQKEDIHPLGTIMGRKLEVATSINLASTTDSEEGYTPKLLFKVPKRPKTKACLNKSTAIRTKPNSAKSRKSPNKSNLSVKHENKVNMKAKIQNAIQSQKEALKKARKASKKAQPKKKEKEKVKLEINKSRMPNNIKNIIQQSLFKEYQ